MTFFLFLFLAEITKEMIFSDIINEIKKNEYITEVSYHSSGE